MTRKQRNLNHYGLHRALSVGVAVAIGGLTLLATPVLAQCEEPLHTWHGEPLSSFGSSVSGAGDVNADGFNDVIVGAYNDDTNGNNSGSASVFSGATGELLYIWYGDSDNDRLGTAVSGAGDVNADGFADLIVAAPRDDSNGDDSGSVYVFSGANGELLYTWYGNSANDRFGDAVSGAGDVNADGFDDLIVGAWRDDTDINDYGTGSVLVFSGATGEELYNWQGKAGTSFGRSVSGAGDVNGDGFDDLIIGIGSHENGFLSGSATVFSGATGAPLYTWFGDENPDFMGNAVDGAGDVDGDGFGDLIVGSFGEDTNGKLAGAAYVFSGATGEIIYSWYGEYILGRFGSSVSSAGDVNGDGFDDLIVGASGEDVDGITRAGSAYIYSGATGSLLQSWHGDSHNESLGSSVSGAGDVNGDGFIDVIVGASGNDQNGQASGSAFVFTLNCSAPCPWDLDGSGDVGVKDLLFLLGAWGPCP